MISTALTGASTVFAILVPVGVFSMGRNGADGAAAATGSGSRLGAALSALGVSSGGASKVSFD